MPAQIFVSNQSDHDLVVTDKHGHRHHHKINSHSDYSLSLSTKKTYLIKNHDKTMTFKVSHDGKIETFDDHDNDDLKLSVLDFSGTYIPVESNLGNDGGCVWPVELVKRVDYHPDSVLVVFPHSWRRPKAHHSVWF